MSGLLAASSLRDFFKGVLGGVIQERQLQIAEVTEFYLVNLLSEFVSADRLFTEGEDGRKDQEPLAVLYHRAMSQAREERIRTLRRLGDVSLYTAGFFSESLRERVVGPDYYIQMGGTAYGQVAELAPMTAFSDVYRELHRKFRAVVEVLEEIAARGLAANGPEGALKVYESWARTGSERLEKVLVDAGVLLPKPGLPN